MSEAENKVVKPVAEGLVARLISLWIRKGTSSVTYVDMFDMTTADNQQLQLMMGSHFHCGRALAYAKRQGWVHFEGCLSLDLNGYRAADDLRVIPGPKSNWRDIERSPHQLENPVGSPTA